MSAKTKELVDETITDTADESILDDVTPAERKNIISSVLKISLLTIFLVIGCFAGLLVGKIIIGKIDIFDPSQYSAENYLESARNIAYWKTKSINDLTPVQIFAVAQSKLDECDYYSVYTKGYNGEDKGYVTTLGIRQDLYGYRYKANGRGYFDYYSTGLATVVKKVEYAVGEDKFYCYEGVVKNGQTNWTIRMSKSEQEYHTAQEYKEMVGVDASTPIDYIISTKTVIDQKSNGKQNGYRSYTLKLDNATSVLYYVKKMKYMSGFDYPTFKDIELRFEVDEQMNLQNMYISESYVVLGMDAESKYKMEFHYEDVEIR